MKSTKLYAAVVAAFAVLHGDNTFLEPTRDRQLRLCTGTFNPIERKFAERLVVVGELEEVASRGRRPDAGGGVTCATVSLVLP